MKISVILTNLAKEIRKKKGKEVRWMMDEG